MTKKPSFPRLFFLKLCVSFVSYFLMTLEHAIWHFDLCCSGEGRGKETYPHVAHLQIWLVCFIFDLIKKLQKNSTRNSQETRAIPTRWVNLALAPLVNCLDRCFWRGPKQALKCLRFAHWLHTKSASFRKKRLISQSLNSTRVPEFQWHCTRIVVPLEGFMSSMLRICISLWSMRPKSYT